jgi:sulfur carrier protein ThiS
MTTATVKLYASLSTYLPSGAVRNAIEVSLPTEATIGLALEKLNVPPKLCHLVLLNGIFVPPGSRSDCAVANGDTISVWPPVAGG